MKTLLTVTLAATAALAAAWFVPLDLPPAARRMTFVFVLAAILWAFEIIPLHATAVLVVVLEVLLIGRWKPSGPGVPYETFLAPLASPVVILFLGGFMLAAAFRKHGLDQILASRLVSLFGTRPPIVTLGFLATTGFFALWMSSTATAAMMLAMISPLLAQIDEDDPFRKALVLAIPFGTRVGAVGTPVGTPPNAIAVGVLQERGLSISFGSWMAIGLPLSFLVLAISWLMLCVSFPAKRRSFAFVNADPQPPSRSAKTTMAIALFMAGLWLTSGIHGIPDALVALIGTLLFLVLGVLNEHDLKRVEWHILILMWGGLALGEGIQSTGLADAIVRLPVFGGSPFRTLAIFCVLAMFISTFLSNTTSANLLLPLAVSFPSGDPVVLSIAVALACSFDIPIPIASPPNALAFATRAISVRDMLKPGIPIALAAIALIIVGSGPVIRYERQHSINVPVAR